MAEVSSHQQFPAEAPIPLIDLATQYQSIAAEITAAVGQVFATQQFVLGDEVAQFEHEIAEFCDSREAVGCGSGTDALLLSLLALDIGPGDEVITSPFTFFATAGAIHRAGATPVFVDIDPVSFNCDPQAVEAAITDRTRAIMPVHIFGQSAEMEPLWRLSVRHGLAIIEDACQAIGAEYRGRQAGVLGTLGCFSFFPTKNLGGAGDGGLITTDDHELATKLRSLRVHGQTGVYHHDRVGINSRLDALQAAVLRVKLKHLSDWTTGREQNAKHYAELFHNQQLLDAIDIPSVLPDRRHVFNQYTVRVKGGRRDEVLQSLRERGIGCNVYYPLPLHLQECFKHLGHVAGDFPAAEAASAEVLSLPVFPEMTTAQIERVVAGVASALGRQSKSGCTTPFPRLINDGIQRAA